MNEPDAVKVIEAMGKFMKQTNEILTTLQLRIDNFQIDVEKLRKEITNYKNNGSKMII